MKISVELYDAEDGTFRAVVPSIPGCTTQGASIEELTKNLFNTVEGCLGIDLEKVELDKNSEILKLDL